MSDSLNDKMIIVSGIRLRFGGCRYLYRLQVSASGKEARTKWTNILLSYY
jgi:hypothetical protein